MDPNVKQSIIDRLKQTNNVLVTVKKDPTVDQLAACIGLTLFLNKQGKHATAVYSGETPSTLEFLKPDDTLEKDTNSLRDFIIALDKSKADKLRYKVEDKVVKIFITPYKTSLSEADLDFSQGDFNVDVVIALGVHKREELDQAIMAHGRILHDATVVSINTVKAADLGALNWHDDKASSLSEMTASLVDTMQPKALDEQMSTAFLTGIVAETARFSNEKTSSATMSLSAKLMAAGANQQLVATKLQEPAKPVESQQPQSSEGKPASGGGTLEINHPTTENKPADKTSTELPKPMDEETGGDIHIDEDGNLRTGLQDESDTKKEEKADEKPSRLTLDPPTMGGTLTASAHKQGPEPSSDPLSAGSQTTPTTLDHNKTDVGAASPGPLPKKAPTVNPPSQTLSALEEQMDSPHVKAIRRPSQTNSTDTSPGKPADEPQPANPVNTPATGIDDARKAVEQAAQSSLDQPTDPLQALNAQPLGADLHPDTGQAEGGSLTQQNSQTTPPMPGAQSTPLSDSGSQNQPPNPPPPVPPPMMPPNSQ